MDYNLNIDYEEHISDLLSKNDLTQILVLTNRCLTCGNEKAFNNLLLSFSVFLQFEFVLYAYTKKSYQDENTVHLENISNPEEWATEYNREEYLLHDPIRHELRRLIDTGSRSAFILWDNYTWKLSPMQQQVIERRNHHGLHHGFSFFIDSKNKDFMFVFSFASRNTLVTPKLEILCKILGPHLMATRKRLIIQSLIATLSEKEKLVASWVVKGKTNGAIAKTLSITVNTVKFHIKNIFKKLQVTNRQQAIIVLLTERYLRT